MRKTRKSKIQSRRPSSKAAANNGFGLLQETHFNKEKSNDLLNSAIHTSGKLLLNKSIGYGTSIHLHGKTVANYDNGTGTTRNLKTKPATDCIGCADSECVTVSGTFALTFRANPTITLPSPSEYAHLKPCQQERVRVWIRNVLLPHEKQHKAAFERYTGVVNKPFQMKICRSEWSPDLLQPIHDAEDARRKKISNDASDALDPFHTNIDLDCEDKETITNGNAYIP